MNHLPRIFVLSCAFAFMTALSSWTFSSHAKRGVANTDVEVHFFYDASYKI